MSSLVLTGDTSGQVTLAAPAVAGTTTITAPAVSGTMSVLSPTQSMVRLITSNGYGSTNTMIKRYSTTVTNQGSDITYADSATLGASFTINTSGVYAATVSYNYSGVSDGGLSLNSTQLTTQISSITATDRLVITDNVSGNNATCSWIGYISAGSVLRVHTASGASAIAGLEQFTIVRVI